MYVVCELRMSSAVKTTVKVPIGTTTVADDGLSSQRAVTHTACTSRDHKIRKIHIYTEINT